MSARGLSLHVGVDIDEVLYGWYDRLHRYCVAAGITNGVTPRSWNPWEDYGCTEAEWVDVVRHGTTTGLLYLGDPIPGTVHALGRLCDAGHQVHLVTARGTGGYPDAGRVKMLTTRWLDEYAVPHHTLTFAADKRVVRSTVFIDDSTRTCRSLQASGVHTCMQNTVSNRDDQWAWKVDHLDEFVNGILHDPESFASTMPAIPPVMPGRW